MRMRHPVFILAFFKLALLATVHQLAVLDYWYWRYPWLDTAVHFTAGLTIGLFITWFLLVYMTKQVTPAMSLGIVLAGSLVVGVLWEIFEMEIGAPRDANFIFDTKMDLIADIFGALVANLLARKFFI